MEALTQHTHQFEPIILYLFRRAVIIVDSVAFEEERQNSDLIEWSIDEHESSYKVLFPGSKFP